MSEIQLFFIIWTDTWNQTHVNITIRKLEKDKSFLGGRVIK